MNARNVSLFARLIARPSGLILVTGPTGSGKSTTLYNALESIATGERNIITLEDPIEYKVSGLTQMQINPKKGFTFATGLKTILRQDPDVIMVGEIRDQETAKMAIDAAATGHLVFSTLHAVDTIAVQGRVKDLGIEITRYADVMLLVLAQRLVRLTCPRCSEAEDITREQLAIAGLPGAPQPKYSVVRGKGCPHCHETGYRGREGIYEFFSPNDELRAMMGRGDSLQSLRRRARALGMRTILEDGLTKVLLGRTTLEEVMRVTS
jgi:type II secretory ATPase GspE/PulE/Tfp pilus assembly ATPase PilB-like protein